jgi:hypothetical protein
MNKEEIKRDGQTNKKEENTKQRRIEVKKEYKQTGGRTVYK